MDHRVDGEAGMTLIELLVTLTIVGVLFVTLTQGLFTGVLLSGVQHKHAGAEVLLRGWAESLKLSDYAAGCATPEACADAYGPAAQSLDPSARRGFAMVLTVACWRPAPEAADLGGFRDSCSHDHRLQRLTLTVRSKEGPANGARAVEHTVEIVKRRG